MIMNVRTPAIIASLGTAPEGLVESDVQVSLRDGSTLRGVNCRPKSPPSGGSPLVVLFFGGGFVIGSPENELSNARLLAKAYGVSVLCAGYRTAPEHVYPTAVNDGWDAVQWAAKNGPALSADLSKGFIVGGTSAGGNIAASIAHLARDAKLSPPLTGQYLSIPLIMSKKTTPEKYKHLMLSEEQNAETIVIPTAFMEMVHKAYKPDQSQWLYHPFNHPDGHAGLPPAYSQICGMDPLRDGGLVYEKVLREESGVKTKLDLYPGQPHGFWGFFPTLKAASKFKKDLVAGFGFLLGQTPDSGKLDFSSGAAIV